MAASVPSSLVWSAQAVSSTTVYTSSPTDLPFAADVSYMVDVVTTSGPVTGTMLIEVSNATDAQVQLGTDKWTTLSAVTPPAISGSATFGLDFTCRYRRSRLKYTNASGTGTITAIITVKAGV